MAVLGKLTAGVAHEMNTPIGALKSTMDVLIRCANKMRQILGFGETLSEIKNARSFQEILNTLEQNSQVAVSASERISKIVNSLKSFARLDEAEHLDADINESIETTLTLIQHEITDKISITKEFENLPQILCYPGELNQVFMILLTKAIQAIEDEGVIMIRTSSDDTHIRIIISDTGKGIPPEQLDSLFEIHFTTKEARIGMGIDFANVLNIIQKHNGKIDVESEVGKGTTFSISLPINQSKV
jgi:signal transduction histidine kinase